MAITLGTRTASTPSAKLRTIGDSFIGAVIDEEQVQRTEYGTNEPMLGRDGKPKTQDMVTVMVIDPGTAVTTEDGADRGLQVGEVVRIFFASFGRWDPDLDKTREPNQPKSWSGAKEDRGQLSVGDVLKWQYERDQPGANPANPRKVRTVQLRAPRPDEAPQTAKCEALHREKHSIAIGSSAPAKPTYDEEPF